MTVMMERIRERLESNGLDVYNIAGMKNAVRANCNNRSYYFYDEFVHVKIFVTDMHMIDYSKSYMSIDETLTYIDCFTSKSRQ